VKNMNAMHKPAVEMLDISKKFGGISALSHATYISLYQRSKLAAEHDTTSRSKNRLLLAFLPRQSIF
ncbi:hypothetical protein Q6264_29220, partial [Klebsiella pneumoniae]|uniref:hypothetical protein n=1 Tax=Klebsiella pneumoniae TaxID=573 RepID=UPI00273100FA